MKFRALARGIALLVIGGIPRVSTPQDKPLAPPYVPGEVIVKFSSKSKAAEWMTPKEGTSEPREALRSYIRSLSSELDIPIEAKRLGSGGSLILSINQAELISRWSERLRANGSVKDVQALPLESSAVPIQSVLQVEFVKGSPDEKVVSQIAASGRETGPGLQSINERLQRVLGCPPVTLVLPSSRLQIMLDLNALTMDLAKRLGKRDDVEYAQPNFLRRRMSATARVN